MTDSANGHQPHGHEIVDQLRQEFIDEANERLQALDVSLDAARHGHKPEAELVKEIRRAAVLLRGQAANLGMRPLALVAHRLDDYLADAPQVLPPRAWDDLQTYLDTLEDLAGTAVFEGDPSAMARALPRKLGFEPAEIEVRNVEVLLVMPQGAQTHFVERELQQCGYRVAILSDTIEAFAMVVQTKPDLIIVSAMMPHLDGIDLAMAFAAMPSTRNIPMAVITSFDRGDPRLDLLPKRVPVVFKGPTFGDDLFKALDNLFLI
jgi:CheY-like chemotaxis protein